MSDARDCGVRALLVEPVGSQFETVCIVDKASARLNFARQVSGDYLVDGVASKPRKVVGDGVLGALKLHDFDRVLHKCRDQPADPRAVFRLFRKKKPRERLVVGVRMKGHPRRCTRKC